MTMQSHSHFFLHIFHLLSSVQETKTITCFFLESQICLVKRDMGYKQDKTSIKSGDIYEKNNITYSLFYATILFTKII